MVVDLMKIIDSKIYFNGSFSLIRPEWLKNEFGFLTGEKIKIAVIDSGCDKVITTDSRIVKGISFIGDEEGFTFEQNDDYFDKLGHGTACIDIILQIAPAVEIIPIKVFNSSLETSIEIIVAAINYAIDYGVDLINLSLGTKLSEALYPLYVVCEKAKQKNIIIVSANGNLDNNSYPAIFENVISISSTYTESKFDFLYNSGDAVECLADGYPTNALGLNGRRQALGGNSFASPIVTGIVTLLVEKFSSKDLDCIRQLLEKYSINNKKSSGRRK